MTPERQERLHGHIKSFVGLSNRVMRSAWIITEDASIYVRRAAHVVAGKGMIFLDIGNIEVVDKRQGTWTYVLKTAQELTPWNGVYIQNIHSPILRAHLERLGAADERWVRCDGGESFAWVKDDVTVYPFYDRRRGE